VYARLQSLVVDDFEILADTALGSTASIIGRMDI